MNRIIRNLHAFTSGISEQASSDEFNHYTTGIWVTIETKDTPTTVSSGSVRIYKTVRYASNMHRLLFNGDGIGTEIHHQLDYVVNVVM